MTTKTFQPIEVSKPIQSYISARPGFFQQWKEAVTPSQETLKSYYGQSFFGGTPIGKAAEKAYGFYGTALLGAVKSVEFLGAKAGETLGRKAVESERWGGYQQEAVRTIPKVVAGTASFVPEQLRRVTTPTGFQEIIGEFKAAPTALEKGYVIGGEALGTAMLFAPFIKAGKEVKFQKVIEESKKTPVEIRALDIAGEDLNIGKKNVMVGFGQKIVDKKPYLIKFEQPYIINQEGRITGLKGGEQTIYYQTKKGYESRTYKVQITGQQLQDATAKYARQDVSGVKSLTPIPGESILGTTKLQQISRTEYIPKSVLVPFGELEYGIKVKRVYEPGDLIHARSLGIATPLETEGLINIGGTEAQKMLIPKKEFKSVKIIGKDYPFRALIKRVDLPTRGDVTFVEKKFKPEPSAPNIDIGTKQVAQTLEVKKTPVLKSELAQVVSGHAVGAGKAITSIISEAKPIDIMKIPRMVGGLGTQIEIPRPRYAPQEEFSYLRTPTINKVSLIPSTAVKVSPVISTASLNITRTLEKQKQIPSQIQQQALITNQLLNQDIIQRQVQRETQIQKQVQRETQIQRQVQRQGQRLISTQIGITYPKIPIPIIPPIILPSSKSRLLKRVGKEEKVKAFVAEIRRGGKFFPVSGAVTKETALAIGEVKARQTLAASIRVREVKGEPARTTFKPTLSPKEFYASKKEPGVYIQLPSQRLGRKSEVQEIMSYKKKSGRKLKGGFI